MVVAVVLTAFIWVTIVVVVGVLLLGVCCVVKVIVVVVMTMLVVGVVVVGVMGNERAITTTINSITDTNTPDTPINQVNK